MIWDLGKVTPYGECYPRDLFRQIVSNPMKGAIKALKTLCFRGFFSCSDSIYFGQNNSNGALGAPLCGARLIPHHTHYARKMYTVVPQWCPELLKSYEK